ncbi:MAG: biotin--[acetyl-CoA-carboxylase] ligase [Rhodomicrobium sp.]|nr:biotin--[acetyl-CoA-carboxylase] ligase [Rhodomicrobium sp.]
MNQEKGNLPVLRFESLDSTNEEALRQLAAGSSGPVWIVAEEQTRGRGRSGRIWQSPKGNLYASLLFKASVSPLAATQLSFVAALATYDAIAKHIEPERLAALRLKWPNDVMLGGAKLAGILIESLPAPEGEGLAVIIGIGINVSEAPVDTGRPVATLGSSASAVSVFGALAGAFETWLPRWDEGRAFAEIREAWLSRALALNHPITVNLNGNVIRGRFRGIDPAGALQLETEPGVVIKVNAGDIYPDTQG